MPALDHLTRDAYPKSSKLRRASGSSTSTWARTRCGCSRTSPPTSTCAPACACSTSARASARRRSSSPGSTACSVVAADLWVDPTEAAAVFRKEGVDDRVLPMRVDAHALPFGRGSFDAIVSIDAWEYFGTGDHYPPYLATFLKPGGQLGVATPALTTEVRELGEIPEHIDRVVGAESRRVAHRRVAAQPVGVQPRLRGRHGPQPAGRVRQLAAVGARRHGAQGTAHLACAGHARGRRRRLRHLRARHREGRVSLERHRPRPPAPGRRARPPRARARRRALRLACSSRANGEVLFEDHNHVVALDATQHPEFAIARWAGAHLTAAERAAATVYTSGEHCPMCSAAHGWVGLGRIAYAVSSAQLAAWRSAWGAPPSPVAAAVHPRGRAGCGRRRSGPRARGRGPRPAPPLRAPPPHP